MKIRSFFIYVFLLQIVTVFLLWSMLLLWLQFDYLPSFEEDFNRQQQIVTQGFADTLGDVVNNQQQFTSVARTIQSVAKSVQNMYMLAMENGLDIKYDPILFVFDNNDNMLFTNYPTLIAPPKIAVTEFIQTSTEWHFTSAWDSNHHIQVIMGESYADRKVVIGNPASGTAIPLAFTLVVMLIAIVITAYFSLRPLRQAAKIISSRQPGNLSEINIHDQFKEIRPIIEAINKLMSRVKASNQREKQFMADAAHELRTPIAAVIAQLHLLTQIQDIQERTEVIKDMHLTLNRTASLSHQLINIARLDSEDFPIKLETIDITAFISHIITQHVPYALNKHIDIEFISPDIVNIISDKTALSTIFTNLLENAIKYSTQKGKIKVIIKDLAPFGATISVLDNGRGIPQSDHQLVFSRFFRVHGTTEVGSGLGLSIAQNLAVKIKATIRLTDGLENQGVGFIIDLHD